MNKFIFVCLFLPSIVNAKGLCYQQQDLISFNNIISSFNSLKPYLEENDLKKDCEQVGNYIAETHKLDKERHTNLYILYNGYGKHKID